MARSPAPPATSGRRGQQRAARAAALLLWALLLQCLARAPPAAPGRPRGALLAGATALYAAQQDRAILLLNASNFNAELIQHRHPFPHVKLIEYYVSFCGICVKFKHVYSQLARDLHGWRNVIRLSAIDLGVSSNSPIAHSWSVETVPTLRLHPPPGPPLAAELAAKLERLGAKSSLASKELQRAMFEQYNSSRLAIQSLDAIRYKDGAQPLRQDLLAYLERFVAAAGPAELPASWPNLRPAAERSLAELARAHPRQELFLAVEPASGSDQSSSAGLALLLELSASEAWRAVRYVRAADNPALVADVAAQLRRASGAQQARLLEAGAGLALVHLDDCQALAAANASAYPHLSALSAAQLEAAEAPGAEPLKLLAAHVRNTYADTAEDREFVRALADYDDQPGPAPEPAWGARPAGAQAAAANRSLPLDDEPGPLLDEPAGAPGRLLARLQALLEASRWAGPRPADFDDKLKALRYVFFHEAPRKLQAAKGRPEQQDALAALANLAAAVRAYFPLPDAASIQFVDGALAYLRKQQARLAQPQAPPPDLRLFRAELRRLEALGRRLPEVREWRHCRRFGYPCALWRLFHTLAAFEYKKLSQIRLAEPQPEPQPSPLALQQPAPPGANLSVERLVSPPSTSPNTPLSLTIATPTLVERGGNTNSDTGPAHRPLGEADLPHPVILVMRDYVTNFFSCDHCAAHFGQEARDLSLEGIRHKEPAEFSVLWLWETHNRLNKRLSVDPATSPSDYPKVWFPSHGQCSKCYHKPPSYLGDGQLDPVAIFRESIDWDRREVLDFLVQDYTRQPQHHCASLFGYQIPAGAGYVIIACVACLALILLLRCASDYIERQRRHKANLLNANGTHYTLELQ